MSNELYRDFIDRKADAIINSLGGTITPAPANAELYRDFLDRKFDDVINAIDNVKIKSFTYKGTGTQINDITFPTKPTYILSIYEIRGGHNGRCCNPFAYGQTRIIVDTLFERAYNSSTAPRTIDCAFNDNIVTIISDQAEKSMNYLNYTYNVYYI